MCPSMYYYWSNHSAWISLALNNPVFPSYVNIAMKKIEKCEGTLEIESWR